MLNPSQKNKDEFVKFNHIAAGLCHIFLFRIFGFWVYFGHKMHHFDKFHLHFRCIFPIFSRIIDRGENQNLCNRSAILPRRLFNFRQDCAFYPNYHVYFGLNFYPQFLLFRLIL